ncbi:hypothetical protein K504DRAFT_31841 [Pleomassaria siparia CBS 279.74]|uniref:Uncharacterized protein n=1 Tax=Pleomassaria siparia CBS 279.74 TaxID=1314801 RepID=A0A6G1KSA3_9PLEO|nr:hypothetical protein K504DRAFT_31841 [Pleomassaria siparia CBS 279.74]
MSIITPSMYIVHTVCRVITAYTVIGNWWQHLTRHLTLLLLAPRISYCVQLMSITISCTCYSRTSRYMIHGPLLTQQPSKPNNPANTLLTSATYIWPTYRARHSLMYKSHVVYMQPSLIRYICMHRSSTHGRCVVHSNILHTVHTWWQQPMAAQCRHIPDRIACCAHVRGCLKILPPCSVKTLIAT